MGDSIFDVEYSPGIPLGSICCASCGIGISGKDTVKLPSGDSVCKDCSEYLVSSGEFSGQETLSVEKSASIHNLASCHPEVREKGCVVCGNAVGPDDYVVSVTPQLVMSHRECISSFIDASTPKNVVIAISKMNGISWDSLISTPLTCKACGGVVSTPVVVGEDIYHEPCFSIGYLKGTIPSEVAELAISENRLSKASLQKTARTWILLQEVAALKREADNFLSTLWKRFHDWASSLVNNIKDVSSSYDDALDVLAAFGEATASVHKLAISPEVERSMALLAELTKAEEEHKAKLDQIMASHQVTNLVSAKSEASARIAEYLGTLKSKQRIYQTALFRFKEVVHRGSFSAVQFRDAIRALFSANAEMTSRINTLAEAATKPKFTTKEVEVLITEPEVHPSTERLRDVGVPVESTSPAPVPQPQSEIGE